MKKICIKYWLKEDHNEPHFTDMEVNENTFIDEMRDAISKKLCDRFGEVVDWDIEKYYNG